MAILKNGPLGGFQGKVGAIVGYFYKGKMVIRSMPKKSGKPPTPRMLANRARFKLAMRLITSMTGILRIGYHNKRLVNAFDRAKSHLLTTAVAGQYPDFYIDYPQLKLSAGKLPPAYMPTVTAVGNQLRFTWREPLPNSTWTHDQAFLLAWFPAHWEHRSLLAYRRSAGEGILELDLEGEAHVWLFFCNQERTDQSESQYLGMVNVSFG